MKLEVVNGQAGFIGKFKELETIEKAIELFGELFQNIGIIEHDVEEYCNRVEITLGYDMDDYDVKDIHHIWKINKKSIMAKIK